MTEKKEVEISKLNTQIERLIIENSVFKMSVDEMTVEKEQMKNNFVQSI